VSDLRFYDFDAGQAKRHRRLLIVPRRILRRILRPIFDRQIDLFRELYHRLYMNELAVEEMDRKQHQWREAVRDDLMGQFREITRRQDELDAKLQTLMALGWDHVAMARRLAALEDQIASLSGSTQTVSDEGDPHPSILFPGLAPIRSDDQDEPESCSRVG
jgi:hypothetical protein